MLRIKQVLHLEETLELKLDETRVLETSELVTDPNWNNADDYYLPTQLAIKEYVLSQAGSAGAIGTPSDGTYTDGYF